MPRPKRIWIPGGTYHITARGNRKSNLFRDKKDYQHYMALLRTALQRYPTDLHAYCLMPNHLHLILGTINHTPTELIHYLHSVYARYFNHRYDYVGHLFQGRFYSKQIRNHKQLLDTSAYIHLNPVKANYTKLPEDYLWSSYGAFLAPSKSTIIHTDKILSLLGEDPHHKYQLFVETRRKINEWNI
ncbi:REP-associated tyrosine transposase [Rossellomorea marisflavi]|uniref:REP-associated tyrosine transposase n=1 Tax=Rossellomorea marisflavi TaxID=189381 RepID=UPI004043D08D